MKAFHQKLRIPAEVVQLIQKLHPQIKRKIRGALDMILQNPLEGKPLKDEFEGLKSFRVSRFRIIYRHQSEAPIEIISIGPRKNIYTDTYHWLKAGKDIL